MKRIYKCGRCLVCGEVCRVRHCQSCAQIMMTLTEQRVGSRIGLVKDGIVMALLPEKVKYGINRLERRLSPILKIDLADYEWEELISLYRNSRTPLWFRRGCQIAALAEMLNRMPPDGHTFWKRHPSGGLWVHVGKMLDLRPTFAKKAGREAKTAGFLIPRVF